MSALELAQVIMGTAAAALLWAFTRHQSVYHFDEADGHWYWRWQGQLWIFQDRILFRAVRLRLPYS